MISIITALFFAFFFVELHQFNKKWGIDYKPFNCSSCLAGWSALVIYLLPDSIQMMLLVVFASGSLAPLFIKLYQKFYYGKK